MIQIEEPKRMINWRINKMGAIKVHDAEVSKAEPRTRKKHVYKDLSKTGPIGGRKLTEDDVRTIRASSESLASLAERYGYKNSSCISRIINNETYKWVK